VALAVCAAFIVLYSQTLGSNGMFMWDEAEYASIGRSLVAGEGFSIDGRPSSLRPPALPLTVAASLIVSGRDSDAAALAPMLFWALLALGAAYWGAWRSTARGSIAVATVALLAPMPLFWLHASRLLSEVPFMACFTLAIWHLHLAFEGRSRSWLWSGVAIGFALHARYTGVLYALVAIVWAVPALVKERGAFLRRTAGTGAFWLGPLGVAIVLSPWLVRQAMVFGDPLIGFRMASRQLPIYKAGSMPWSFYLEKLPEMVTWPMAVLAALGAVHAFLRRDAASLRCLGVVAVILTWLSSYAYKETRLVSAALPFIAFLAAAGLVHVVLPAMARLVPAIAARAAAIGLAAAAIGHATWGSWTTVPRIVTVGYPVFLQAVEALKSKPPGPVIGASQPQLSWYARRPVVAFPRRPEELVLALAKAEWAVVVTFERGQPDHVLASFKRMTQADVARGDVAVFADGPFKVALVRTAAWRERLTN
jgi:4-amino-4-deoxy-L-arabinose transferase-like glycosyltransferase